MQKKQEMDWTSWCRQMFSARQLIAVSALESHHIFYAQIFSIDVNHAGLF